MLWTSALSGGAAFAMPAHHHNHKAMHQAAATDSPSTAAYKAAMGRMHEAMMIRYTGDTDVDFAAGMAPHHRGAIDMARVELQYGKDQWLRKFASWIVLMQTDEEGGMRSWLYGRTSCATPEASADAFPDVAAYGQAMEKMHRNMMIDYSGDADLDFVRGMIGHHQGAIDMAAIEMRSGKNFQMHDLALNIINSQQQEIHLMQRWLRNHGYPLSDATSIR